MKTRRSFFKILAGATGLAFTRVASVFAETKKKHYNIHPLRQFPFDGGWKAISADDNWIYATFYYNYHGDYTGSEWIYFKRSIEKNLWYYQGASIGTGPVSVADIECSFFKIENNIIYYCY